MGDDSNGLPGRGGNILMTVQEAASYLRFHPSTVYRLVRAGQLPALKLGKQWRVSRDALQIWELRHAHVHMPERAPSHKGVG